MKLNIHLNLVPKFRMSGTIPPFTLYDCMTGTRKNFAFVGTSLLFVKLHFLNVALECQDIQNYNLSVVLCGCETWSLTFKEQRGQRVLENGVLRRIFGPKRDKVTVEWRKLHNDELHVLYCSPNIVRVVKWRRMRWAGHVARMEERRGLCRALMEKPEGKRPLGRPRRRWEDNIKMDLQEVGRGAWNGSSWLRIGTVGGHS